MTSWRLRTIQDICTVFDGPHATPVKTETGPWFLSISSLVHGRLVLTESAHVSDADFTKWTRRVTPQAGDLLFSYETRLGDAALMPPGLQACLGRRMGLLRPKLDQVDPKFLLYNYLGPEFQHEIATRAIHGATVDRIPLAELPKWRMRLPSLPEQRAIAEVLGALDDKIVVNERIAETATELAEALYIRESSSAQGWVSVTLSETARWLSGGTPKTSEPSYWGGDIPWISAASLKTPWIDNSDRKVTPEGAENGTRLVPEGSIIFVVRGMSLTSEFRIGLTQREVAFGQDCKALIPHAEINPATLFLAIKSMTPEILGYVDLAGHGTGRLATDRIANLSVKLPDDSTAHDFAQSVVPLIERASATKRENRTLAALRNTLLPQLVTGKLRIKDAERVVEDAV
ncbi:restriction endonuclease subunit S [Streptomyces griseoloalbus]|nr:restriction endonuclease subunit S [Streptomyces albaduncus]GGW68584.1 type I restriction system specificity protein [Streptomyces albaduncus]